MNSLLKPILLSCLLSLFVFGELAMAQKGAPHPPGNTWMPEGRNQRIPPRRNYQPQPQYSEPQRPTPPHVPTPPQYQTPKPPVQSQPQRPVVLPVQSQPERPLPSFEGTVTQRTQTIEVRGSFPSIAHLPFGIVQGLRLGIGVENHHDGGVRVTDVVPNSPGHRAGFEVGDVILEINETPINDIRDYSHAIDTSPAIMEAKLNNVNDDRVFNRTVELGY